MKQRTVVIIFPEGARRSSLVVDVKLGMANEGLAVTDIKKKRLSEEEVAGLFPDRISSPDYPAFARRLTDGKSIILVYWEEEAVPRALGVLDDLAINVSGLRAQASDSVESFEREYGLLFPEKRW